MARKSRANPALRECDCCGQSTPDACLVTTKLQLCQADARKIVDGGYGMRVKVTLVPPEDNR